MQGTTYKNWWFHHFQQFTGMQFGWSSRAWLRTLLCYIMFVPDLIPWHSAVVCALYPVKDSRRLARWNGDESASLSGSLEVADHCLKWDGLFQRVTGCQMSSHLCREDLGCHLSCRLGQRWLRHCSGRNVGPGLWHFSGPWFVWLWVWISDSDRGVGAFLYDPLRQSISEHKIILIWLCFYCQVKESELNALVKTSSGPDLCREPKLIEYNRINLFDSCWNLIKDPQLSFNQCRCKMGKYTVIS